MNFIEADLHFSLLTTVHCFFLFFLVCVCVCVCGGGGGGGGGLIESGHGRGWMCFLLLFYCCFRAYVD